MHPARLRMAAIAVLGGTAVLGSYAHGFTAYPETVAAMWGGVPEILRPLYTAWMFVAAAGFFAFASYLFVAVDPDAVRVGRFGFDAFNGLYLAVLAPSALWMPLTRVVLESPGKAAWWWAVRIDLWLVAVGSLGLIAALVALRPRPAPRWHRAAVAGACAFAFQTAVLDALVWPVYFPR